MHEALAWKRTSAIPLATVEAGNGLADLEPLRGVIGDARIVSLGDPRVTLIEFDMPVSTFLKSTSRSAAPSPSMSRQRPSRRQSRRPFESRAVPAFEFGLSKPLNSHKDWSRCSLGNSVG